MATVILLQNLGTLETKSRAVLDVYAKIMEKNAQDGAEDEPARLERQSSGASIGSRIRPALASRPPSSIAPSRRPQLQNDDDEEDDSDDSPVVPLSRQQLQAQLFAQT